MKLERNAISRTYVAEVRTPTAAGDARCDGEGLHTRYIFNSTLIIVIRSRLISLLVSILLYISLSVFCSHSPCNRRFVQWTKKCEIIIKWQAEWQKYMCWSNITCEVETQERSLWNGTRINYTFDNSRTWASQRAKSGHQQVELREIARPSLY